MTPETVFLVCNNGILFAWLLLAVAPGWRWTERIVHAAWIPLPLAIVYAAAFLMNTEAPEGGGFGSLPAVMTLFTSPWAMLAGWVHYLVFDLFVGAWEVRDARRRGIAHWMVLPCLFFTLMLGPIGLGAYLLLRGALRGAWTLVEEPGVQPAGSAS
jgi:hypothetical protein